MIAIQCTAHHLYGVYWYSNCMYNDDSFLCLSDVIKMEVLSVLAIETELIELEYIEVTGFWYQQGPNIS